MSEIPDIIAMRRKLYQQHQRPQPASPITEVMDVLRMVKRKLVLGMPLSDGEWRKLNEVIEKNS